jgi:hypothetical protein
MGGQIPNKQFPLNISINSFLPAKNNQASPRQYQHQQNTNFPTNNYTQPSQVTIANSVAQNSTSQDRDKEPLPEGVYKLPSGFSYGYNIPGLNMGINVNTASSGETYVINASGEKLTKALDYVFKRQTSQYQQRQAHKIEEKRQQELRDIQQQLPNSAATPPIIKQEQKALQKDLSTKLNEMTIQTPEEQLESKFKNLEVNKYNPFLRKKK